MSKTTTPALITAQDLETQAQLQRVSHMRIVETAEGYELHAPLRSWLSDEMKIEGSGDSQQVVIKLSETSWMALRTRRDKQPRKFKNMATIFAYVEETFPLVTEVDVKILPRNPAPRPVAGQRRYAGKTANRSTKTSGKPAGKQAKG